MAKLLQLYLMFSYFRFKEISSTQKFLMEQSFCQTPLICMADSQTAGYGQQGRTWNSPVGGFYCSLRYFLPYKSSLCGGLTQDLALTIVKTLDPEANFLKLKWPNDLFSKGEKVGGILVESLPHKDNCLVIIGIGIDLFNLGEVLGLMTNDNLLNLLAPNLFNCLKNWEIQPYIKDFLSWEKYDLFFNQTVELQNYGDNFLISGIDQKGRLIAKKEEKINFFSNTRIVIQ